MKKHILGQIGKKSNLIQNRPLYYDFKKQISFLDNDSKIAAIDRHEICSTTETFTIEDSDEDEFNMLHYKKVVIEFNNECSTYETATIENSDDDEFYCRDSYTTETRSIENSDEDEFRIIGI